MRLETRVRARAFDPFRNLSHCARSGPVGYVFERTRGNDNRFYSGMIVSIIIEDYAAQAVRFGRSRLAGERNQ